MVRKFSFVIASAMVLTAPTAAFSASVGYNLRLEIPVSCSVRHQPVGYGMVVDQAVSLGQFREYCNAPGGYQLIVRYTPGTLDGALIVAGEEQVVLTGSGHAVLSQSTGPRIRERAVFATPGENGFDTDMLEIQIIPLV